MDMFIQCFYMLKYKREKLIFFQDMINVLLMIDVFLMKIKKKKKIIFVIIFFFYLGYEFRKKVFCFLNIMIKVICMFFKMYNG